MYVSTSVYTKNKTPVFTIIRKYVIYRCIIRDINLSVHFDTTNCVEFYFVVYKYNVSVLKRLENRPRLTIAR